MSDDDQMWQQEQAVAQQRRARPPLELLPEADPAGATWSSRRARRGERGLRARQRPGRGRRMSRPRGGGAGLRPGLQQLPAGVPGFEREGDLFRDWVDRPEYHHQRPGDGAVRPPGRGRPRLGTFPAAPPASPAPGRRGWCASFSPTRRCVGPPPRRATARADRACSGGRWTGLAGNPASPAPAAPATVNQAKPIAPEAIPGVGKGLDRAIAAKFFPGVWQRASGDPDAFIKELAETR